MLGSDINAQEAVAAIKANPLPEDVRALWTANAYLWSGDKRVPMSSLHVRAHIAAAVNAAPVLVAEVERLQKLLSASERLRAMEAQAVALAIREPGNAQPSRISVICALRGVTLPEDFLPAVERICAENDRLKVVVEAARVAVEKLPPYPHTQLQCSPREGCHCTSAASNTARSEARSALGLE